VPKSIIAADLRYLAMDMRCDSLRTIG